MHSFVWHDRAQTSRNFGVHMKAVILAGGLGTRISEQSHLKPKPMIEIGGMPILWHIMKLYSHAGITEFVICCGYKSYQIKEFFANYVLHRADVTVDLQANSTVVHNQNVEPWKVTLIDTGPLTNTGGRLKRVAKYLNDTFCLTYGDGVSNVDIQKVIAFHKLQGVEATVTAVQPSGRFGSLEIDGERVTQFMEKPAGDGRWVSGGFFVCEPSVITRISGDEQALEGAPLEALARDKQLAVWKHRDFWASMDTMRDKQFLEDLWNTGKAPWKLWE